MPRSASPPLSRAPLIYRCAIARQRRRGKREELRFRHASWLTDVTKVQLLSFAFGQMRGARDSGGEADLGTLP